MLRSTRLHAKSLNRYVEFLGYNGKVYCLERIQKYYPKQITITGSDQPPEGAVLVSENIKLVPTGEGKLAPVDFSTYRDGVDVEEIEIYWEWDHQFNRWREVSECPDSFWGLNEPSEIVLQAMIQGCQAKEIFQTLQIHGYYTKEKLVRTHIGGYIPQGISMLDYLRSIGRNSNQAESTKSSNSYSIVE